MFILDRTSFTGADCGIKPNTEAPLPGTTLHLEDIYTHALPLTHEISAGIEQKLFFTILMQQD